MRQAGPLRQSQRGGGTAGQSGGDRLGVVEGPLLGRTTEQTQWTGHHRLVVVGCAAALFRTQLQGEVRKTVTKVSALYVLYKCWSDQGVHSGSLNISKRDDKREQGVNNDIH